MIKINPADYQKKSYNQSYFYFYKGSVTISAKLKQSLGLEEENAGFIAVSKDADGNFFVAQSESGFRLSQTKSSFRVKDSFAQFLREEFDLPKANNSYRVYVDDKK